MDEFNSLVRKDRLMKLRGQLPILVVIATGLFMISCLLPGMIPLKSKSDVSLPKMETDANAVIKALSGKDWHYLQELAEEKYPDDVFAKPGTVTYTVNI